MNTEKLIASNEVLGLVLTIFLLTIWWRNRAVSREFTADADRGWRQIVRATVVMLATVIAWNSLFDNWRQLTAIPFQATRAWNYQRGQLDPPSHSVRTMTFVLVAVLLVLTACLVARHVGGYFIQVILVFAAVSAWIPFYIIRSRFSLDLAMGMGGSWGSPTAVAGYLGFVLITWLFDVALIMISFLGLVGLVAIPVTLVLDLTRLRRPRITTEAAPFFNAIGQKATTPSPGSQG